MITAVDLQELARLRLQEAEVLYGAGFYNGSSYLCGYVIELALKACICKTLDVSTYPESERAFKTHDFDSLQLLAGLQTRIAARCKASQPFDNNWSLCIAWKPDDRYVMGGKSQNDARDLLDALGSKPEGVLAWLSQQW